MIFLRRWLSIILKAFRIPSQASRFRQHWIEPYDTYLSSKDLTGADCFVTNSLVGRVPVASDLLTDARPSKPRSLGVMRRSQPTGSGAVAAQDSRPGLRKQVPAGSESWESPHSRLQRAGSRDSRQKSGGLILGVDLSRRENLGMATRGSGGQLLVDFGMSDLSLTRYPVSVSRLVLNLPWLLTCLRPMT